MLDVVEFTSFNMASQLLQSYFGVASAIVTGLCFMMHYLCTDLNAGICFGQMPNLRNIIDLIDGTISG